MPQPHSWRTQVRGEWCGDVQHIATPCRLQHGLTSPICDASKASIAGSRTAVKWHRKNGSRGWLLWLLAASRGVFRRGSLGRGSSRRVWAMAWALGLAMVLVRAAAWAKVMAGPLAKAMGTAAAWARPLAAAWARQWAAA